MKCLISLKLLKEHDPPLQDTYVYRCVHIQVEKHRHTQNRLNEKLVSFKCVSSDHTQANFTV